MKKLFVISSVLLLIQGLWARNFQVFNDTDKTLHILWKSNGLASGSRQGEFNLQPGNFCAACIQTHDENCVHILYVKTIDGKYRAQSAPFCKDAEIIVSFNYLQKKLDIDIKNSEIKASL